MSLEYFVYNISFYNRNYILRVARTTSTCMISFHLLYLLLLFLQARWRVVSRLYSSSSYIYILHLQQNTSINPYMMICKAIHYYLYILF